MAILILAISTAQEQVVRSMRSGTRPVKRLGGVILILVGSWLMALALWADALAAILPA
jgi:cytochrome c biogenesis protein CcdA